MSTRYEIKECKSWVREGFSPRAAHVVEHEGFDLISHGFRVVRDGVTLFPAYPPMKTLEEAEAMIAKRLAGVA